MLGRDGGSTARTQRAAAARTRATAPAGPVAAILRSIATPAGGRRSASRRGKAGPPPGGGPAGCAPRTWGPGKTWASPIGARGGKGTGWAGAGRLARARDAWRRLNRPDGSGCGWLRRAGRAGHGWLGGAHRAGGTAYAGTASEVGPRLRGTSRRRRAGRTNRCGRPRRQRGSRSDTGADGPNGTMGRRTGDAGRRWPSGRRAGLRCAGWRGRGASGA